MTGQMVTATADMANTIGDFSAQLRADFGDRRYRKLEGLTREDIRTQITLLVHNSVGQVIKEMVEMGVNKTQLALMLGKLGMWGVHVEWHDSDDTETVIVPLGVFSIGQSSVTSVMYEYFNRSFEETTS